MFEVKIRENPFPNVPFQVLPDAVYSIAEMQIIYTMYESSAKALSKYLQQSPGGSVESWFNSLSADEKRDVQRFDLNSNKYL